MADDSVFSQIWLRTVRFFNRPWISVVVFGILISVIAFWNRPPHMPIINRGTEATFSYKAPYDFSYDSKISRERKVQEAVAKIMPHYKRDNENHGFRLEAFKMIAAAVIDDFDELREADPVDRTNKIEKILTGTEISEFLTEHNISISKDFAGTLPYIVQYSSDVVRAKNWIDSACKIYEALSKEGICADGISVPNMRGLSQFSREFENSLEDTLSREVYAYTESRQMLRRNVRATVGMFGEIGLMKPNVFFDGEATKKAQTAAAEEVPREIEDVKKGESLLVIDELITDEIYERWQAFREESAKRQSSYFGGSKNFLTNTIFALFVVVSTVLAGRMLMPDFFRRRGLSSPLICAGIMTFANVVVVRVILEIMDTSAVDILLPNAHVAEAWLATMPIFSALVCVLIAGAPLAIVSSGLLCGIVTLMLDGSAGTLFPAVSAALVTIHLAGKIRKRTQMLAVSFYAGMIISIVLIAVSLYTHDTPVFDWISDGKTDLLKQRVFEISLNVAGTLVLATALGLIAAAVISPIERFLGLTSNITLIELTDFNHPLLRNLQYYAPGTYNHSVAVSNFAAAAAEKIGANVALCRCAGLFHDIGKLERAYFFTENQGAGMENPHSKLTPEVSALVIRRHVKAGIIKADEYHLPQCVKDLIQQHHGRSYVTYFLKKAKELEKALGDKAKESNGASADKTKESDTSSGKKKKENAVYENFRYDGPAPQTKEAVVLLCCDVVEAASRSFKDPSMAAVESRINELIDERLAAGEFNESQITMRELDAIKKSLFESIITANHRRISYSQGEIKRAARRAAAAKKG